MRQPGYSAGTLLAGRRCARISRWTTAPSGGSSRGPRPWAGQPGAPLARELAPEIYDVLSHVYFLGPMRAQAKRTTVVGQGGDRYVGPAGERMVELLHDEDDLLGQVNAWCQRLGLGYRVRMLAPVSHDIVISAG